MKYDNLLKTIFLDAMPALLRAIHCAPVAEFLTVEFPERPKMVADIVARLIDGKILHLEFQLTNDPRMHWRCYHYFGAIQEQWEDSEVIQVVIYLGNGPMSMRTEIQKPSLNYRYHVEDIRGIPANVFLDSPNDAERVLALLCESIDPRATVRQVLVSWKHLSDKALLENIERLRTLSRLRKFEIIALEEIGHNMPFDLDITESLDFKMGEVRVLTRMLESRFGALPEDVRHRFTLASVDQISKDQIEQWAIRALGATSLTDVFGE